MKVLDKLFNKGVELINQEKYSEAVKWYFFYNKCS